MGVIPARLSGLIEITPAVPAWLTPLSSTLVHGGALHLALNMLMLVWCGTKVERILGLGRRAHALSGRRLYGRDRPVDLVARVSPTPMIGASGAISAVIGAFALSFGQQKRIVSSASLNRTLNALWLLAAWIVLQIMTGLLAGVQGFLLATPAHIGGFVAGTAAAAAAAALALPEGLGGRGGISAVAVRLEQPVQVDDDIFHLGIVNRALGAAAPGVLRLGVAVEEADEVDGVEIDEIEAARVFYAAAEHQMKLAHGRSASRISRSCEPARAVIRPCERFHTPLAPKPAPRRLRRR